MRYHLKILPSRTFYQNIPRVLIIGGRLRQNHLAPRRVTTADRFLFCFRAELGRAGQGRTLSKLRNLRREARGSWPGRRAASGSVTLLPQTLAGVCSFALLSSSSFARHCRSVLRSSLSNFLIWVSAGCVVCMRVALILESGGCLVEILPAVQNAVG